MKTWITRLQANYKSLEEWRDYNQTYGLARNLGFVDALEAWHANPLIGGSTNLEDFGLVKLDEFTMGYITCALWSSRGGEYGECPCCGKMAVLDRYPEKEYEEQPMCSAEGCGVREMNEEPALDENYNIDDIAPNTLAQMVNDCARFQDENSEMLAKCSYPRNDSTDMAHAGHDFWLTRCGHGAGFGDGDLEESVDDALCVAAKQWSDVELYVGNDGKIYNL